MMNWWDWAGITIGGLFILYLAVRLAGHAWYRAKKDFIIDLLRGGTKDGEEKKTKY